MRPNFEKTLYLMVCLLLAILLAVYVGGQRGSNITREAPSDGKIGDFRGLVTTKTAVVTVPLQLNGLDADKYYVAGAPETVKIEIEGASALVTTAQNTKNFQVYADLTDLDTGEHRVTLKESGLNNGLTFKINPEFLDLTITKRATATHDVQVTYNESAIAEGYHTGKVSTSVDKVEISGRADAVWAVNRVIANVQLKRDTNKTVNQSVVLQAVDANGTPINVAISPQIAKVEIPIEAGEGNRDIPVKFVGENGDLSKFEITGSLNEVRVSGLVSELDLLKSIEVPIDLKNVTEETTTEVEIPTPKGTTIKNNRLQVTIKPKG
ncbi:CdaR family protein [Weissella ceti]|uniref:CdaR family protein n=1 Tax=Weissella ceti TaxID=759620 RepID=A0ABT3E5I3_9LACO|nr:CdaR family protein [Weissella ceti]MCW0953635.1 CdaR family protein [Weissella ceti]QVK12280.1 hypothetical protein KHQ31_01105 [Weissella ceti]